jgi:hypothetical protein
MVLAVLSSLMIWGLGKLYKRCALLLAVEKWVFVAQF